MDSNTQDKLRALLAAHKNRSSLTPTPTPTPTPTTSTYHDKYGKTIYLNSKQQEFVDLVLSGKSCILIGAAGTGKTTTIQAAMQALIQSGKLHQFGAHNHKHLPSGHAPALAISAYTRRATNNIRKNLPLDLQANAVTIHKLLQYEPVYYETDAGKTTMRFEPTRNALNPQPHNLRLVVLEEASMIAVDLFSEVEASNPQRPQYILLGDIQQLPPVFGSAILGFKMLELPVVELTEVYRQALESPIIKLAHRILSGVPIPLKEYPEWHIPGKLRITEWKKKISPEAATKNLAAFFHKAYLAGEYSPDTDGILIPFDKACGAAELNKHIANTIAKHSQNPVWEIIHGFRKSYYSIGDKCLYEKEDAIVKNIFPNPEYTGALTKQQSPDLDYWGNSPKAEHDPHLDDVDQMLAHIGLSGSDSDDPTTRAASHCVVLTLLDSEREVTIKAAGEFNNLSLGYAITVHKSQGSEWKKVFLCIHHTHATMIQRELLYTAVTRAREELFVICEDDTFTKGILNQRIKGNTLEEKAQYFMGKLERGELQS